MKRPFIPEGDSVGYDNKGDSAAPLPLYARLMLWLLSAGFLALLGWSYVKEGF